MLVRITEGQRVKVVKILQLCLYCNVRVELMTMFVATGRGQSQEDFRATVATVREGVILFWRVF